MYYPHKHKPYVVFSRNVKLNSLQETVICPSSKHCTIGICVSLIDPLETAMQKV